MKQIFFLMLFCLTVSVVATDKIVGGVQINSPGYFVSLVDSAVGHNGQREYYPFCGASLIKKDGIFVVLTAAHCVEDLSAKLFVTMKATKSSEINADSLVPVKAVIIHPGYDKNIIVNDLALLILDEASPLLKDPTISIVPIHVGNEQIPGRELTVMGFGNLSSYGDLYPDHMYSVGLLEDSLELCKNSGPDYQSVDQRQICADNNNQGKKRFLLW